MTRTIIKWAYRCLGWIALGGLALVWAAAYAVDRHEGYGTLALRLVWNHEPYLPSEAAIAGAELKVRGRAHPLDLGRPLRLRPGPAPVELNLAGFVTYVGVAKVAKNADTFLDAPLKAKPGTIRVRNRIPEATIDGAPCGAQWTFPNAEIGRAYSFTAAAPGYEAAPMNLRISHPGEDLVTDLVLKPLMGGLAINLVPAGGTELFLNGVARDSSSRDPLRVGVYSLTATNPDYFPFSSTVEVRAKTTNLVEVQLRPKPAAVALEVTPAVDFQVRDGSGNLVPVHDFTAQASPGQSTLTLTAPGYAPVHRDFFLEANKTYSWKARLEREGTADFQKYKEKFQLLATPPQIARELDKLGGLDWKAVRAIVFDNEDLARGGRQYSDACVRVSEILQSFPERGRAWTNEVRAADAIYQWLYTGQIVKATDELARYTARFGPNSAYDRWFGAAADKIQAWQDDIQNKQRYLPEKPKSRKQRQ